MSSQNDQLVVRQHERVLCKLPAHVRVADACATQIVLARTTGDASGTIDATIVDCSRGGLGIQLPMFLPRAAQLIVRLKPDVAANVPGDVELLVRIQRASMTERTPMYYLGVSFKVPGAAQTDQIERLLAIATRQTAQPSPSSPTAGTERKVA